MFLPDLDEDGEEVFSTPPVPIVRSRAVVKIQFQDKDARPKSVATAKSSSSLTAISHTPSAPPGKAKPPMVHPSLSSDSLASILNNEQLLKQRNVSRSSSFGEKPVLSRKSSMSANSLMELVNNAPAFYVGEDIDPPEDDGDDFFIGGDDDRDVISLTMGEQGQLVAQQSMSLDDLSSQLVSRRPTPQKQLEIMRKLIEQYGVEGTKLTVDYGFVIHAEWLRKWIRYLQLSISGAFDSEGAQPGPISNWSLLVDARSGERWRGKSLPTLSSSISFASLLHNSLVLDEDLTSAAQYHSTSLMKEYFDASFDLRRDRSIKESEDFFLLPKDAWEALYRWYGGGPPLPRALQQSLTACAQFPFYFHLIDLLHSVALSSASSSISTASSISSHIIAPRNPAREDAERMQNKEAYREAFHKELVFPSPITPSVREIVIWNKAREVAKAEEQEKARQEAQQAASLKEKEMQKSVSASVSASMKNKNKKPVASKSEPCSVCHTKATLRCTGCAQVFYCSPDCQQVHWKRHRADCEKAREATEGADASASGAAADRETSPMVLTRNKGELRGKVGLVNLGNTCYLNSSLQCLSHVMPLSLYFLSRRFEKDINVLNKDGTGGKLSREFSSLLQELWMSSSALPASALVPSSDQSSSITRSIGRSFASTFGGANCVAPRRLRSLLGQMRPEYGGLQQQDAHEVIELLLDTLHEDVNRVDLSKSPTNSKVYVEKIDGDGSDDIAIARESWFRHGQREQSAVKDCVGSLMRSQLTCPTCAKVSVSFEYHNTVQIAIPRKSQIALHIVFIPEIPTDKCPPFDGKTYTRDNALLTVSSAWSEFQPRKFNVTVDRLVSMKSLKLLLLKKYISKEFSILCDKELVLLESPMSSPDQVHSQTRPRAVKALSDEQSVGSIGHESVLYAYATCSTQRDLALVHMRESMSGDDKGSCCYFGFPLLLSYKDDWTTRRFQYHIWLNTLRFLSPSHAYTSRALDLYSMQQLVQQFELSDRSVSVHAVRSDSGSGFVGQAGSAYQDSHQHSPSDLALGARLCYDAKQSVVAFKKDLNVKHLALNVVLAVQFENDLRGVIDAQLLDNFERKLSLTAKSQRPGMRNRLNASMLASTLTLEDCLADYTREEELEAGNEWYCNVCREHKRAKKIVSFVPDYLPKVLVLTLKRFEFRSVSNAFMGGGDFLHREKIENFVDFPLQGLNLREFCMSTNAPVAASTKTMFEDSESSRELELANEEADGLFYDLVAVCNHFGRMGFGHYTAMARDWDFPESEKLGQQWFQFDDDHVSAVSDDQVTTANAYILFYRRRD